MIEIVLPFPDKVLWPNGRPGHWAVQRRAFKNHKQWARVALYAALGRILCPGDVRIDWTVTVHPKTRHVIDRDNALSSLKAYQDGVAEQLGINDNQFNTPTLTFGEPIKGGLVKIRLDL